MPRRLQCHLPSASPSAVRRKSHSAEPCPLFGTFLHYRKNRESVKSSNFMSILTGTPPRSGATPSQTCWLILIKNDNFCFCLRTHEPGLVKLSPPQRRLYTTRLIIVKNEDSNKVR